MNDNKSFELVEASEPDPSLTQEDLKAIDALINTAYDDLDGLDRGESDIERYYHTKSGGDSYYKAKSFAGGLPALKGGWLKIDVEHAKDIIELLSRPASRGSVKERFLMQSNARTAEHLILKLQTAFMDYEGFLDANS